MPPANQTLRAARPSDEPGRDTIRQTPVRESVHERIRRRAFELFLQRSGAAGDALSDWLEAERQVRAADQRSGREDAKAAERGEALLAGEGD